MYNTHGIGLRGLGDAPPKKLKWGTAHASLPNISRSSFIGCVTKYELTKRYKGGIFCFEIEVFREEKVHTCICYIICCISDFRQLVREIIFPPPKLAAKPPPTTEALP